MKMTSSSNKLKLGDSESKALLYGINNIPYFLALLYMVLFLGLIFSLICSTFKYMIKKLMRAR